MAAHLPPEISKNLSQGPPGVPKPDWRKAESAAVKYWEIIADRLSQAGWSWGWVSAIDSEGRTIWIADAHRGDGKAFRCASR
jgi:hypothetical protein